MMKFFLVALSLIVACHASTTVLLPQPAWKLASPLSLLAPAHAPLALAAQSAPIALAAPSVPLGLAPAPLALSALHPGPAIQYISQPQIIPLAPAIQTGYVAANRGAVHIAPLPGNPLAASHHLNLEPAPGTI